jgi:hypothetical protein
MIQPARLNPRTAAEQADLEFAGLATTAVVGMAAIGYFWLKARKSALKRQVEAQADFERRAGKMRERTAKEYTKEYVPGASKVL